MIREVLDTVRASSKTAYCFIENAYEGSKIEFHPNQNPDEFMKQTEVLEQSNSLIKEIFYKDMEAEMSAENFLLVFPAGVSGHMEAGVAYGAGKRCYAVGAPEKTETLYCIFEEIFPDVASLSAWLSNSK